MSKSDLYECAKNYNIKGRSKLSREDLLNAVRLARRKELYHQKKKFGKTFTKHSISEEKDLLDLSPQKLAKLVKDLEREGLDFSNLKGDNKKDLILHYLASKLCSCIKKVNEKIGNESRSIAICKTSVLGSRGLSGGKFSCKKSASFESPIKSK